MVSLNAVLSLIVADICILESRFTCVNVLVKLLLVIVMLCCNCWS